MKAKLNLSGEGIKQFFLVNGEKLALGVVAIALLGFFYSAITAKPLDETKSPEVIKRESATLMGRIQEQSTPPAGQHAKLPETPPPVSPQQLKWQTEISPLLFPELKKRTDPTIFPVEELQIASGVAIVGYGPPTAGGAIGAVAPASAPAIRSEHAPATPGPGTGGGGAAVGGGQAEKFNAQGMIGAAKPGAEPREKTYAIITGSVSWSKQCEEYSNRFEFAIPPILPAIDPSRSTGQNVPQIQPGQTEYPDYYYFNIDRAEISDPNDTKLNWVSVLSPRVYIEVQNDVKAWSVQWQPTQDIVHPSYVFPPREVTNSKGVTFNTYITWPLPPLFLKDWGFEVAHPKVKLNVAEDASNPQQQQNDSGKTDEFGATAPAVAAAQSPGAGMNRPGAPGFSEHDTPPRGRYGGVAGFGQAPPAASVAGAADALLVDNKLFRFIDFTAQPGKTYRYRVQLAVRSPNYGLQSECLAEEKLSKSFTLSSAWVETGPITIPRDYRLLADSVSVIGKNEPKAKMSVLAIIKAKPTTEGISTPLTGDVPLEALKELSGPTEVLSMGGIIDLHDLTFDDVADVPEGGLKRKVEKVTIDTDQMTLLDLRNDDPLGTNPKSKGPTEMLFMDANGRLTASDSAADSLVVADFKERTKVPPEQNMQNIQPTPDPTPRRTGPTPRPPVDKGTKGVR